MSASMLERYGGLEFVSRLVLEFYDRVQASPRLGHYFVGVDMRRLVDHQAKFISTLLGGPISYSDTALAEIHRHLGIAEEDFEEMVATLDGTLESFALALADRAHVVAEFRRRHDLLVQPG